VLYKLLVVQYFCTNYNLYINVHRIFVNEYIKRIKENKTLQKCTFLMKVKKYILTGKYKKVFKRY
jgi:hypothetical protein